MISEQTIQRIIATAKLTDIVPNLKKAGKDFYTRCPFCEKLDDKAKKGIMIDPVKNIAKCFSCGKGISGPVDWLMKVDAKTYPEALTLLADRYGIAIEEDEDRKERLAYEKKRRRDKSKTFLDLQMEESGLTFDDIRVKHTDKEGKETHLSPFRSGTRTQYGVYLEGDGDDYLIYYYDLDGNPVQYKDPRGKMRDLIRVRFQNPEAHKDKNGRPIKYQSPAGSGTHLYIPEKIRTKYKAALPIETLFIQEGEKKAEKACKHGIHSVGVMGIQNIGQKNGTLPEEVQLIVQQCDVKNIVFLLDADWNQLSGNLKNGDPVDQRPRNFFNAVKNFKDYIRTLVKINLPVEIWFGHINDNEKNDKGVDDLLANSLKKKEDELKEDFLLAMHDKNGKGKLANIHKITTITDQQLMDYWLLNDSREFARFHKKALEHLQEFKIGKLLRRFNEKGELEMAQPLLPSEQFWEEIERETRSGDTRTELNFDYANCFNFLQNRGFFRYRMKSGEWKFIHIESKIIHTVDNYDIKDYVTEFTKELSKKNVLNMLYRGGPQYLGHEKLSNLMYATPNIERAGKTFQNLYFKDKVWEISQDGIKEKSYAEMKSFVWSDRIVRADVKITKPLLTVTRMTDELRPKVAEEYRHIENGEFFIDFTEIGKKCHFLQFLNNASNFTWKKERDKEKHGDTEDNEIAVEELFHNSRHLINKLTAMGYLLHDYKNDSELKAVIAMDGKLSEVGSSNGRTGKSLFGKSIEYVIPQEYIAAKNKKLTEDQFIFGEITEKTKNIFLDDVRANVDFEFFFPLITGKLKVNPKGGKPFTLEQHDTPKLVITTNHAINGEGSSFRDRQAFVAFSDYYNDVHKPIDDFGVNFFSEWDNEQWNLYFNLKATCLQLYFTSIAEGWAGPNQGIVEPPMESIEMRRLRQQIGEDVLQWAEVKFAVTTDGKRLAESSMNMKEERFELYNDFKEKFHHAVKYVSTTRFGKNLRLYCKYKGYHFNPNKLNEDGLDFGTFVKQYPGQSFIGEPDKTGGKEYFTIANEQFTGTI